MKKCVVLLIVTGILISCLGGCGSLFDPRMEQEQLEQYREYDPNVIWEQSTLVLQRWHGIAVDSEDYYGISGVPTDEFIARFTRHAQIGGADYEPRVLIHQNKDAKLVLDASSARLTMRESAERAKEEAHRMALGKHFRERVICEIELQLAQALADQLVSSNTAYLDSQDIWDTYGAGTDVLYAYSAASSGTLYVEFCLEEYESLLWVGQIRRVADDYVIVIRTQEYEKYLVCDDALRELIDQVVQQNDLITWNEKALNGVDRFSFAEHKAQYPEGTPGVHYDGFVNTTEYDVLTEAKALERAKSECTVEWDTSHVAFDHSARVWLVEFSMQGVLGGCQSVYLTEKGVTVLIVYGE